MRVKWNIWTFINDLLKFFKSLSIKCAFNQFICTFFFANWIETLQSIHFTSKPTHSFFNRLNFFNCGTIHNSIFFQHRFVNVFSLCLSFNLYLHVKLVRLSSFLFVNSCFPDSKFRQS